MKPAALCFWGVVVAMVIMSAQAAPTVGDDGDGFEPDIAEINEEAGLLGNMNCGEEFDCDKDCQFGYKKDDMGCPTCHCIDASDGDVMVEGDIIFTRKDRDRIRDDETDMSERGSIRNNLWPGGVVVYTIDRSLARNSRAMQAINAGMTEWTSKTCIRFKKRTNERAYINFKLGSGCSSYVGKTGSRQDVNLASGCWYSGIVAHEIGHALGFYHEQSRPDRDNYVTIHMENIYAAMQYNFNKYPKSTIDSLGTAYDYGSVMHYGARDFSKNGQPTIVPKKSGVTLGQRSGISAIDAHQMNLLYKCGGGDVVPTAAPPSCVDKNRSCPAWGRRGYCSGQYADYMKKNCAKTCNTCS